MKNTKEKKRRSDNMTSKKKNKADFITLTVGDWSGDGHSQTEKYFVKANLDAKQIQKAFENGIEILGCDPTQDFEEYEASSYSFESLKALIKHFGYQFVVDNFVEDAFNYEKPIKGKKHSYELKTQEELLSDNEDVCCSPDCYVKLYLNVVKLGKPKFEFEIFNDSVEEITVGGYGLYSL